MTKSTPKSTIISCVYDILGDSQISKWYNDGTIEVARPTVNVNLENIKFRSFSANIKSDIQNLTSPNINAKLCGNFTWYKNQKQAVNPPSSASTDVIEGTEIPITPYVQDLRVTLYNQGGVQQYEAANGLYHNDINNDIVFTEFDVPLVTSFQDSVNDMLKYAKYNLTRLLGLYNDDQAFNKNIYDTSTFVYGEVNLKPFISGFGSYKYINVSCGAWYSTSENYSNYQLTYNPTISVPKLTAGIVYYKGDTFMDPKVTEYEKAFPFALFSMRHSYRCGTDSAWLYRIIGDTDSTLLMLTNPWTTQSTDAYLCQGLAWNEPGTEGFPPVDISTSGYFSLCSQFQNGYYNYFQTFYRVYKIDDAHKITKIDDMRRLRRFSYIFDELNRFTDSVHFCVCYDGATVEKTIVNFGDIKANNNNDEVLAMRNDDYYLLTAFVFHEGKPAEFKYHLFLFYVKDTTLKCLEYRLTEPPTTGGTVNDLPDVHRVTTITLPQKLQCFANEWTVENYLQYTQELNNVCVTNTPILILPRYEDGSNDFLYVQRESDGETSVYQSYTYNKKLPDNVGYNYFINDNVMYATQYPKDNTSSEPYQISAVGPTCFLYDGGNEAASEGDLSTAYDGNGNQVEFYNKFWVRWNFNRFTQYGRDITATVKKHNLKFPIFNAFGNYGFTTVAFDYRNLVNITDKIAWIVDANGAQAYIKEQTFENIYSFAQSALSVSFTYSEDEAQPKKYIMYPATPTIGESATISPTTYSWINDKHITSTFANPYFYANDSIYSFIDNTFKVDDNGKITFPCIPVVTKDGSSSGLLTFFVKFETSPAVFTFDPNIKQSDRFANMYNFTKQFINRTPSLYNDKYPFDDYIFYNNKILYDNLTVYLELKNRDLTLKLRCLNYPSPDNVVFYLNETSMVDFKECVIPAIMNHLTLLIIDADGEVLTPELAKNIYSNINICIDWEFMS